MRLSHFLEDSISFLAVAAFVVGTAIILAGVA